MLGPPVGTGVVGANGVMMGDTAELGVVMSMIFGIHAGEDK